MSDSGSEFICSQISTRDYLHSQSANYGSNIIDGEEWRNVENVVSLENNLPEKSEVGVCIESERNWYDNVMIEDISLDKETSELWVSYYIF